MKFTSATAEYEEWLGRQLRIVPEELAFKHEQMRSAPFPFFRATYYRWAQLFPQECKKLAKAPHVLCVGDLHVENFGTWRDMEGRLVWGVNDFDEAWRLPYTNDLARLATSALIAGMTSRPRDAADAILAGYCKALETGGRAYTLAERHGVLRQMAAARLHQPERFWEKLNAFPEVVSIPDAAMKTILHALPEQGLELRLLRRRAGLGSLGRERYVAVAHWRGGLVAREAKAMAPSAAAWAGNHKASDSLLYKEVLERAVRCPDPFVRVHKKWIVRRLAPDCSRIELSALPKQRDEIRLLRAMGWETANIHLGTGKAKELLADVSRREKGWLVAAARKMEEAVVADFTEQ